MSRQLRLSGGMRLQSPNGMQTRPTTGRVREAVMNLLSHRLQGCHWLDLCSGSGVMGCEALRRGARWVVAVEREQKTAQICAANLKATSKGLSHSHEIRILNKEILTLLRAGRQARSASAQRASGRKSAEVIDSNFDLIYLDPPYDSNLYEPALSALIQGDWLRKDAFVICELDKSVSFSPPDPWQEMDHRIYGNTSIRIFTPQ